MTMPHEDEEMRTPPAEVRYVERLGGSQGGGVSGGLPKGGAFGMQQILPIVISVILSIVGVSYAIMPKVQSDMQVLAKSQESVVARTSQIEAGVNEIAKKISNLESTIGSMNNQMGNLNTKVASYDSTINNVSRDVTNANNKMVELTNSINNANTKVSALETRLGGFASKADLDSVAKASGDTSALSKQISDLSNTVTALQKKVDSWASGGGGGTTTSSSGSSGDITVNLSTLGNMPVMISGYGVTATSAMFIFKITNTGQVTHTGIAITVIIQNNQAFPYPFAANYPKLVGGTDIWTNLQSTTMLSYWTNANYWITGGLGGLGLRPGESATYYMQYTVCGTNPSPNDTNTYYLSPQVSVSGYQ